MIGDKRSNSTQLHSTRRTSNTQILDKNNNNTEIRLPLQCNALCTVLLPTSKNGFPIIFFCVQAGNSCENSLIFFVWFQFEQLL